MADQEIKKIAEERRREKQETADAKRRVLEQIEADKVFFPFSFKRYFH